MRCWFRWKIWNLFLIAALLKARYWMFVVPKMRGCSLLIWTSGTNIYKIKTRYSSRSTEVRPCKIWSVMSFVCDYEVCYLRTPNIAVANIFVCFRLGLNLQPSQCFYQVDVVHDITKWIQVEKHPHSHKETSACG